MVQVLQVWFNMLLNPDVVDGHTPRQIPLLLQKHLHNDIIPAETSGSASRGQGEITLPLPIPRLAVHQYIYVYRCMYI